MKIELKKISYNSRLSQETSAFAADLYIDGVNVGEVSNAGHGGDNDFHVYGQPNQALLRQAEMWCAALPPVKYRDTELKMDLELYIGELLEKHLQEKEIAKLSNKGLVFKNENGDLLSQTVFKAPATLSKVIKEGKLKVYETFLKDQIKKAKAEGILCVNTNIPEDWK